MPTVLISGASRGIGLELTKQYAADGWNVIACCRAPEKAKALRKLSAAQASVRIETLDVLDSASIAALAKTLGDAALDLLINNAGVISGAAHPNYAPDNEDPTQTFGTLDAAAWDRVLRTNAIAPLMVTQALLPNLVRGEQRKVAMISSVMGSIASSTGGYIAYRSSKAALNSAMHAVAHDLQSQKITMVSLHPGWVKTDMGGQDAAIDVTTSVTGLRRVIANLTPAQSGAFLRYNGESIPW